MYRLLFMILTVYVTSSRCSDNVIFDLIDFVKSSVKQTICKNDDWLTPVQQCPSCECSAPPKPSCCKESSCKEEHCCTKESSCKEEHCCTKESSCKHQENSCSKPCKTEHSCCKESSCKSEESCTKESKCKSKCEKESSCKEEVELICTKERPCPEEQTTEKQSHDRVYVLEKRIPISSRKKEILQKDVQIGDTTSNNHSSVSSGAYIDEVESKQNSAVEVEEGDESDESRKSIQKLPLGIKLPIPLRVSP